MERFADVQANSVLPFLNVNSPSYAFPPFYLFFKTNAGRIFCRFHSLIVQIFHFLSARTRFHCQALHSFTASPIFTVTT
jgi:hypothetical protein